MKIKKKLVNFENIAIANKNLKTDNKFNFVSSADSQI